VANQQPEARAELIARLAVLGQMDATQTALFQQRAAAYYGVGITEMKALDVLVREGPCTAGRLGAALSLTSGAITGVIDRLVKRGMAHRAHDPADRRRVVVRADLTALAAGTNVYRGIGDAFADLYAGYTVEQLEFLVRHYEASVAITARQTQLLAGGA
jgi:DNA-binding MarR family transcriptional regulator